MGAVGIDPFSSDTWVFFHVYFDLEVPAIMPFASESHSCVIVDSFGKGYFFCDFFRLDSISPASFTWMGDFFALPLARVTHRS